MLHRKDLPSSPRDWQPVLAAAMGSPDHYGRQLDGMGSGVSSTSKVCVVERSRRPDADLDYTFVQVGIRDGAMDVAGNCGNLSAAVGPFGLEEGLLHAVYRRRRKIKKDAAVVNVDVEGHGEQEEGEEEGNYEVDVRIFNTNTSKLITATFAVTGDGAYDPCGGYSIDGVPGTGSRITLSFHDPAGAKTGRTLPTGNPIDSVALADGTRVAASLVDIANPGVFVRAGDLGVPGAIDPAGLEADAGLMARLEAIRRGGAALMGLDPAVQSVPKIVIVSTPDAPRARAGETEEAGGGGGGGGGGVNIVCRALSMQQPHRAVPLTLALNLGAACKIPGTIPALMARGLEGRADGNVTIAHASGEVEVGSVFEGGRVVSALLHRTARVLMKGEVFYAADAADAGTDAPST
jgi:2-methylaconitate cis-trans-isomerase PrpF